MNRKHTKSSNPDQHLEALGAGSDHLRLLEFYRETSDEQAKEIIIGWVENDGSNL